MFNEKLNWEGHINYLIARANKKIGLIWKLSGDLPRYAVENIYTSFIRAQLEYAAVLYNNCTKEQNLRLERCQRRAAIHVVCTRAYQLTSNQRLLTELGWPNLEERRLYFSLILIFKIIHGLTPEYLRTLLPRILGQDTHYETRENNIIIPVRVRTEKYRRSVIPAAIHAWFQQS